MKKLNYSLVYTVLIAITFIAVLFLLLETRNINHASSSIPSNNEVHQSGYQFISPLLECATPHYLIKNKLETELKDIIDTNIKKRNISHASVYLRDLNNGLSLDIYKD